MDIYDGAPLGREIDKIHVDSKRESLERLIGRLKSIEAAYLARYGGDSSLVTEGKRRVAEAIFLVSTTKRAPFEVCRRLFDHLCDLGFATAGREFTYSAILARYALRCGRKTSGIELLEPFVERWKPDGKQRGEFTTSDMELAAKLLRELRGA